MTRTKDDRYYAELVLKEVNKLLDFASRTDWTERFLIAPHAIIELAYMAK